MLTAPGQACSPIPTGPERACLVPSEITKFALSGGFHWNAS